MPTEFHKTFQRELLSGLRGLETRGQRRSLAEIGGAGVRADDRTGGGGGVNFCTNDYLGLADSQELHSAVEDAVRCSPRVGGTGSRLLSGHLHAWGALEQEFADFAGTEAALYFGTGYAANVGLLTSVLRKDDVVFSDELNHASLIDGIRLSGARKAIYRHLDLNALETELRAHAIDARRKFVVTESVFSMDGDVIAIAELTALCERYGAGLILDEAHATAVHGPGGRGIAAQAGLTGDVIAMTHTCSKALASAGAFVCGSAALREHLINHARTFVFSTAMPPYMAGQIRASLAIARRMDAERAQLLERSRQLAASLRAQGYDTGHTMSQIVPVMIGSNEDAMAAAEFLQSEGFAVRPIRPPTVPIGRARLRLSVTCAIAASELARLANCLAEFRLQRQAIAAGCS
jgi:8-amino-7-oxononanoate synthase